jgi:ADP-ribose pyrophosphatase
MSRDDLDIIERITPYRGYFRIDRYRLRHRLFAGGMSAEITREVFERGHAVMVLPYDPARNKVVLIEQFRIGAFAAGHEPWIIETVAGIIETGEEPEAVARREALEEAGCTISDLWRVGDCMVSPGGTSETITLFVGRADTDGVGGIHGMDDENEDIRVHVVAFAEALHWVETGRIGNASTILLLQWLALHHDEMRERWR